MNTLEALDYLRANSVGGSEWQEAGMWYATCKVLRADRNVHWTTEQLDKLIDEARNN